MTPPARAGQSDDLSLAIALSGGGHRATLFALGALMYVVDAGKNRDTTSVASVSGGSITNGFVAQTLDFQSVGSAEFEERVAGPLASQIAQRGTLFAPFATKAYLFVLVVGFVGAWLPLWFLHAPTIIRVLAFTAALLVWGWFAGLRGQVCASAFKTTMFAPGGKATLLRNIATKVSHVLCATEFRAAESVYFGGDFVYGYPFGAGEPGDLALYRAVQASADFPGGFPPVRLPTKTHQFHPTSDESIRRTGDLVLSDGGVYDNMGEQWARGFAARAKRWSWLASHKVAPKQLIVVNASARVRWTPYRLGRIPLLNEVIALLRVNGVMYINTTNVRRQEIVTSFEPDHPAREGELPSVLVQIAQSPFDVAEKFAKGRDAADRANAVIQALGPASRDEWKRIANENAAVATTLSRLGSDVSARLLYQGYVVAMCNLHVIFGGADGGEWPLLAVPKLERFDELTKGGFILRTIRQVVPHQQLTIPDKSLQIPKRTRKSAWCPHTFHHRGRAALAA